MNIWFYLKIKKNSKVNKNLLAPEIKKSRNCKKLATENKVKLCKYISYNGFDGELKK